MKSARALLSIVLALSAVAAYWSYNVDRKNAELAELAQPFQAACKTDSGCLERMSEGFRLNDNGEWALTGDAASFQGRFEYVANRKSFELRWHIATDVYLVARGGAGTRLVVTRVVA